MSSFATWSAEVCAYCPCRIFLAYDTYLDTLDQAKHRLFPFAIHVFQRLSRHEKRKEVDQFLICYDQSMPSYHA